MIERFSEVPLAINFAYLVAAVLFIFGIKGLTRVKTARRGNFLSALAMLVAVVATLVKMETIGWTYIIAGVVVGGLIGAVLATRVKMTAMPQLVAVFNGVGGAASALVALAYFFETGIIPAKFILGPLDMTTILLSVVIGTVTFTGSMVAFAKLQGLIKARPILFKGHQWVNLGLFLAVVFFAGQAFLAAGQIPAFAGMTSFDWLRMTGGGMTDAWTMMLIMLGVAAVLGILLVTPIGGADMPVVIALLNSYSGLAAAMTGFVLKNNVLIISGALVGASGLILTAIMCKAMNRSLANVLFGGFGQEAEKCDTKSEYENVKETSAEEVAMLLDGVDSVIVVPGYGLAVAQAQHATRDLMNALEERGVKVRFAIHPVAGRMPGHMNVLLAEADIPVEKLKELELINDEFQNTDVVLILGANDVVNPAAEKDPKSPIAGMPVLKVWEAKTVVMVKRSLSPGFACIKNELFEGENTLMFFSDAKEAVSEVVKEVKEL